MMEEMDESIGLKARGISRLLEGIFPCGKFRANIAVKIFVIQRDPSLGEETIEIISMGHMSRIE